MKPTRQSGADRLRSPAAPSTGDGIALHVCIGNAAMLRGIYGAETATAFALALAQRIEAGLVDLGAVATIDGDADRIWVGFPPEPLVRDRLPAIVDDLLLLLGSHPVVIDGTPLLAAVSICVETAAPEPRRPASVAAAGDWRTKADMRVAVATFEAIAEGRLYFLFQSITGLLDPGLTLYQECFTRIVDRTTDEELQTPRGFIPALERLGLTPLARRRVGAAALGPGRGPRLLLPELILHSPRRVDRLAQALLEELVLRLLLRRVPRQTLELAREVARRVARPLHVLLGSPCIIRGLGERRPTLFERMRRVT